MSFEPGLDGAADQRPTHDDLGHRHHEHLGSEVEQDDRAARAAAHERAAVQRVQLQPDDVGQAGLTIPKFNSALYAFNMKNRFREFYADKVDVAHTATEEPAEREMSDLELARRVAFMLHEAREKLQRREREQQEQQYLNA